MVSVAHRARALAGDALEREGQHEGDEYEGEMGEDRRRSRFREGKRLRVGAWRRCGRRGEREQGTRSIPSRHSYGGRPSSEEACLLVTGAVSR